MLIIVKEIKLLLLLLMWAFKENSPKKICTLIDLKLCFYLTIRLQARVFYEQIVNEAQPS